MTNFGLPDAIKAHVTTPSQDEEGKKIFDCKFHHIILHTGSGSRSYDNDYSDDGNDDQDKTMIADLVDKKVDIFEQPEETTDGIKISRVSKKMFLQRKDVPDNTVQESPRSKSSSSSAKTALPWIVTEWVPD